jgi:predicted RNase H-like HicB family nuclease
VAVFGRPKRYKSDREKKVQHTIRFQLELIIEPDEGRFHAYCPELKGLHVDGATESEAIENAREAAKLHICSLLKHGDPVPIGTVQGVELNFFERVWEALKDAWRPRRRLHIEDVCISPA